MMRHPPGLLQEAMAHFIGSGYLDVHLRKMERRLKSRWETTLDSMSKYLPEYGVQISQGGTSIWVTSPEGINTKDLSDRLLKRGVLIDEGGVFYHDPSMGTNNFRLGFNALSKTVINEGIRIISEEAKT